MLGNQVSFTTPDTNEWIKISEHPRGTFDSYYRQSAVAANGKCYIAKNAWDQTGPEIKVEESEFNVYDPINGYLNSKTAKFPSVRRLTPPRFSIGNKIYVGPDNALIDDKDTTYYRTIWAYDTETDTWSKLSDYPGPKLSGARAFVIGTKAYLLGSSSSFWEYHSEQDSWKELSPGPISGRIKMAVAINGKGYLVFGGNNRQQVWEYLPEIDHWNRLDDLVIESFMSPKPGNVVLSFSAGGKGYFLSDTDDVLYEFDPNSNEWKGKKIVQGDYRFCTSVNDIIYSFNTNGFDPHSVYAMVPE